MYNLPKTFLAFALLIGLFLTEANAQKTVTLQCVPCEIINKSDCDFCDTRKVTNQYLDGMIVRYDDRPSVPLRKPFDVWTNGRTIYVRDADDKVVGIPVRKTPYNSVQATLDVIWDCVKASSGTDGLIAGVSVSGSTLTFNGINGAFNGSVNLSSLQDGNDIDYINASNLVGTTLNLTGPGNAGTSINLAGLQDGNDIDYINGSSLVGTTLNLTGPGNAGTSINLASLLDGNDVDYVSNVAIVDDTLRFTGVGNAFDGDIIMPTNPRDDGRIWYIATTGDDATCVVGDPNFPCATIEGTAANASPGDAIKVWAGNYPLASTIDADNLYFNIDPGAIITSNGFPAFTINEAGSKVKIDNRGEVVSTSGEAVTISNTDDVVLTGYFRSNGSTITSSETFTLRDATVISTAAGPAINIPGATNVNVIVEGARTNWVGAVDAQLVEVGMPLIRSTFYQ